MKRGTRTCLALLALAFASFTTPAWGAGHGDPRFIPLVDDRGVAFRLADLKGTPTVLTFVATRCTAVCPIANGLFAQLSGRLRTDRVAAHLVTITLDPAYDTPFVMAKYAREFDRRGGDWRFVSGRADDVRALLRSFDVVTENGPDHVPDQHSSFVYVLDGNVRLARTLLLSDRFVTDVEPIARALDRPRR